MFGTSLLPVFDFVGSGHIINIHSDFVGNMGRKLRGRGVGKRENHTCPKLPVLQELQSPVNHLTLVLKSLQLIQGETLGVNIKQMINNRREKLTLVVLSISGFTVN